MSNHSNKKQVKIVIATMAIHNYIKRYAQGDHLFDKFQNDPNCVFDEQMEVEAATKEEYHNTISTEEVWKW